MPVTPCILFPFQTPLIRHVADSADSDGDGNETELRADGKRTDTTEKFYDESDGSLIVQNEIEHDYDALGRLLLEMFSHFDVSSGDFEYADAFIHDLVGNRTASSRVLSEGGTQSENTHEATYVHDGNDRLLIETRDYPEGTFQFDETTVYEYDKTQELSKTVYVNSVQPSNRRSLEEFEYNLQGQLETVAKTTFALNGTTLTGYAETTYEYDLSRNRVASLHATDTNNDGVVEPSTAIRTELLTDTQNHTGYSQILQTTEFNASEEAIKKTVYTIGHDQISQSVFTDTTNDGQINASDSGADHYFGTDGHGSVRVLYDLMAAVVANELGQQLQIYHFDAYGNLLNFADGQIALTRGVKKVRRGGWAGKFGVRWVMKTGISVGKGFDTAVFGME